MYFLLTPGTNIMQARQCVNQHSGACDLLAGDTEKMDYSFNGAEKSLETEGNCKADFQEVRKAPGKCCFSLWLTNVNFTKKF